MVVWIWSIIDGLASKAVEEKIKQHSWALEENKESSKKAKDKKNRPTRDNTLYFQGRYMAPKAVLEKIALTMGYHIRPYIRAGIFVHTD